MEPRFLIDAQAPPTLARALASYLGVEVSHVFELLRRAALVELVVARWPTIQGHLERGEILIEVR